MNAKPHENDDVTPRPDDDRAERPRAIELRGLRKTFHGHLGIGRTPAVRGLDLTVFRGESFGLLGPNGAGKTTTLKMLLGLMRPDAGEVRLLGRSPLDPLARAGVGYLPENPYFYDYLTAEEFLDFYARLRGIPRDERRTRIADTLARVGLAGKGKTPLRKFSKGMVQRVGLAQAIQHDPDLVILDEPMSGLDPVGRREVRDLILSLRAAGKTVFFSSHILQDAEMICDRVAILKEGALRSVGDLRELISGKVQFFEVAIRGALPVELEGLKVSGDGDSSLVRVPDVDSLTELLALIQARGSQVLSVWPRRDSLEDLFMREIHTKDGAGEPS